MVWQDIVITITIIAFSYALVPQIYQGFKQRKSAINLQTSSITSIGMFTLCFVYLTLELYFSSLIAFINASLWAILLFQRIKYSD